MSCKALKTTYLPTDTTFELFLTSKSYGNKRVKLGLDPRMCGMFPWYQNTAVLQPARLPLEQYRLIGGIQDQQILHKQQHPDFKQLFPPIPA